MVFEMSGPGPINSDTIAVLVEHVGMTLDAETMAALDVVEAMVYAVVAECHAVEAQMARDYTEETTGGK